MHRVANAHYNEGRQGDSRHAARFRRFCQHPFHISLNLIYYYSIKDALFRVVIFLFRFLLTLDMVLEDVIE